MLCSYRLENSQVAKITKIIKTIISQPLGVIFLSEVSLSLKNQK